MNVVFTSLLLISAVLVIIFNPDLLLSSMINGVDNAVTLILSLFSIYAIWMSILDIIEKSGLSHRLGRALYPVTRQLFKGEDDKTREYIAMNFSANLLGMGSASTPLGIKAIERMNGDRVKATRSSVLFTIINATSIQLLPATMIGIRSQAGSSAPSNIILPSLIATSVATLVGVLLFKVFCPHG